MFSLSRLGYCKKSKIKLLNKQFGKKERKLFKFIFKKNIISDILLTNIYNIVRNIIKNKQSGREYKKVRVKNKKDTTK